MTDFESYFAGWRERRARDQVADAEARERALELAAKLAEVLVRRYGARRVVLVGSLARGDFRKGSDIDLAVEGLPDESFFAAGAALDALAGGLQVDLVPLESATPEFLKCVDAEGVALA